MPLATSAPDKFVHTQHGYCCYMVNSSSEAWLYNLFVEPQYRRCGHARNLLNMAIAEIRRSAVGGTNFTGTIFIEATPTSDIPPMKLIAFYKSLNLCVDYPHFRLRRLRSRIFRDHYLHITHRNKESIMKSEVDPYVCGHTLTAEVASTQFPEFAFISNDVKRIARYSQCAEQFMDLLRNADDELYQEDMHLLLTRCDVFDLILCFTYAMPLVVAHNQRDNSREMYTLFHAPSKLAALSLANALNVRIQLINSTGNTRATYESIHGDVVVVRSGDIDGDYDGLCEHLFYNIHYLYSYYTDGCIDGEEYRPLTAQETVAYLKTVYGQFTKATTSNKSKLPRKAARKRKKEDKDFFNITHETLEEDFPGVTFTSIEDGELEPKKSSTKPIKIDKRP